MKSLFANVTLVITLALMAGGCGQPLDEIGSSSSSSSQALSVAGAVPTSITFWERSGGSGPTPHTFAAGSQQMLNRLPGSLSYYNQDFCGVCWGSGGEYYDVFYSDADGTFDATGRFITVEAVWSLGLPSGGGLNLAEVQMNFSDGTSRYASVVTSYSALGDNAAPGSAGYAADGNLMTATTMGNTIGTASRLRVTVGFEDPNQPPDCSGATIQPASIWPPDHRLVAVNVGGIDDPDGDPVTVNVVSVFQDEPLARLGTGRFAPDAQIADGTASLRAERSGRGDGRVYHVAFTASDGRGGVCQGSASVCVPHDQRPGAGCVDQGSLYDSTAQ